MADGTATVVESWTPKVTTGWMWDLTIPTDHDFYIQTADSGVLVHNIDKQGCGDAGGGPARFITDSSGNTIDRQAIDTVVSAQRQARHILGSPLYRGGGYFSSAEDAQAVLNAFHSGDADVTGLTRTGNIRVRFGDVTGFNNNPAAGYIDQPTNDFMIKGSRSVSVVPVMPVP